MRRIVIACILGSMIAMPAPLSAKENIRTLDKRVYFCTLYRNGEAEGRAEQLSFEKNLMKSGFFARFGDALYRMAPSDRGTATNFVAETRNGREGKIKWYGAVRGSLIEGTCIWYKHNQVPLVYVLKGDLKPAAAR